MISQLQFFNKYVAQCKLCGSEVHQVLAALQMVKETTYKTYYSLKFLYTFLDTEY